MLAPRRAFFHGGSDDPGAGHRGPPPQGVESPDAGSDGRFSPARALDRGVLSLRSVRNLLPIGAVAVWLSLAALGFIRMWAYALSPGTEARPPPSWPATSLVPRSKSVPTLLVFAHPRCACTRATLTELAKLALRLDGAFRAYALFAVPEGVGSKWADTAIVEQARRIPGVGVLEDTAGREAERFGVSTSGEALLYAPDGRLLFAGGLTAARGHEGDAPGGARIAGLVLHGRADLPSAPVFGCGLTGESDTRASWARGEAGR